MVLAVSDFEGTQLKKSGVNPVLFAASWCPFCAMFRPSFESALRKRGIEYDIVDLSDLENPLWESFEIDVVPTVILFNDGVPVMRRDGLSGRGLSKDVIQEVIGEIEALTSTSAR